MDSVGRVRMDAEACSEVEMNFWITCDAKPKSLRLPTCSSPASTAAVARPNQPLLSLPPPTMLASRVAGRSARVAVPRISAVATRGYAAPAVNSKPPVAVFGLDGTYANALVRLPRSTAGEREAVVLTCSIHSTRPPLSRVPSTPSPRLWTTCTKPSSATPSSRRS